MTDESRIPLAEAINNLRAELLTALTDGKDQPLQFRLRPIELELKLTVTREVGGTGGVKFWVVNLDAKGTLGDATTHTLKLTLEPVAKDGRSEFLVSQTGTGAPPR
ncbi:trypco2 family protein [Rhizobium leguminosarum]|uniref:trypco2 family protein n=1 Tax=Rhizobium leguminosarum TaxID=384 RepID=UPI001441BA73|nr:trypco2 family protein [Rhizobium leguminosarum]NKL79567.1 hypothetical protein [Rhizobium leguminosarum bv. viciae]